VTDGPRRSGRSLVVTPRGRGGHRVVALIPATVGIPPATSPKEDIVKKFRTPLVTAIAIGLLAGSAFGVAAQDAEVSDEAMSPAVVTGRYIFNGTQTASPEYSRSEDGVDSWRGDSWEGITVESSDPRFTGEAAFELDRDIYPGRVGAGWATVLITNENGSWTGSDVHLIRPNDGNSWPGLSRLTGTGDYEGLSVVLLDAKGNGEFEAVIFPGPLPEGE
jgi:hypothetical protein